MDHIQLPTGTTIAKLKVPYLFHAELTYDASGFLDFPERKGFILDGSWDGETEGATRQEMLCLFQSWCFFGLILEFFSASAIEVKIEDFIIPPSSFGEQALISTTELPDLLRTWEVANRNLTEVEQKSRFELCNSHLEAVSKPTYSIGQYLSTSLYPGEAPGCDLLSDWSVVHLSVVILGEYLAGALKSCYGERCIKNWGPSLLAEHKMLNAGWCPSEISIFNDQGLNITSMYYFGFLDRHYLGRDHSACTSLRCFTEQLNWDTYRTKHEHGCDCSEDWEAKQSEHDWVEHICRIVRDRKIPLVQLQCTDGKTNLQLQTPFEAEPLSDKVYVCISHVWSE
jgi:hypothetical protein